MTKIYEFDQNNTGGSFDVDDKLCHRVYIEANDIEEAVSIAEGMGVYFNGCEEGLDCSCCGDRWYYPNEIDLEKPYTTTSYNKSSEDEAWRDILSTYKNFSNEVVYIGENKYSKNSYKFEVYFKSVEGYIQYLVDDFGWTSPDARLFYKDGTVKEFYKTK